MTQIDQQSLPKLRFPGFEGEWTQKPLRAFVDPERKVTYGIVQPGDFVAEGVPLVRGGDYSDGWVPFEQIKRVTPEIDAPYKRSKLKSDDLLITIVGANTGTIAQVPDWLDGANITQTTARIAVHQASADTGYILQCLQSHIGQNEVRKYIKGAAQPGLNLSDVEKFCIPAPTLPEQRKIAAFLSAVDTKIAQLSRKKSLLEDYKKGCMQQLFSQKIRFKDENGNDFPDWEEKRVSDVFRITRGQVLAVPKMTQTKDGKSTFPVYSSQTKNNGLTGYFTDYLFEDAITWTTDGANAGDVQYRSGKFYCTNVCGVLLSNEGNANTCIAAMLNNVTEKYVSYVGNPKLMNNVMGGIKIAFPHPDEQRKIADFLSALDRKIELVGQELEHAKTFKKGLLQQMFV